MLMRPYIGPHGLGGARLSEGSWERVIPAVRDRPGRLKHNCHNFDYPETVEII